MTGPPPPDNPRLVEALERAGAGTDAASAEAFQRALRESVLLAPVTGRAEAAEALAVPPAESGGGLDFVGAVRPEGGAALLGFSGVAALERWRSEQPFVAVRAVDLAAFALGRGLDALWVNPAGPVSATISGAELRSLAGTDAPPRERPPVSSEPALDAAAAATALDAALTGHPGARAAFLLEAEPVFGRRHAVVAIEMAPEATAEDFRGAAEAAERAIGELAGDAVVVNARALGAEEAERLRLRLPPVYQPRL